MDVIKRILISIYMFFRVDKESESYKTSFLRLIIKVSLGTMVFLAVWFRPKTGNEGLDELIVLAGFVLVVYFSIYACFFCPIFELLSVSEKKEIKKKNEKGKRVELSTEEIAQLCYDQREVDVEVKNYGKTIRLGSGTEMYGHAILDRWYFIDSERYSSLDEFKIKLREVNAFDKFNVVSIDGKEAEGRLAFLRSWGNWRDDSIYKKAFDVTSPEDLDRYLRNNCHVSPIFAHESDFNANKVLATYGVNVKKKETTYPCKVVSEGDLEVEDSRECNMLKEEDLARAKELYFSNYANYGYMRRNGEYDEYKKYTVPEKTEHEWSRIIINDLVRKIETGEDIWLVSNLANVSIDESEILKSFQILSVSDNARMIAEVLEQSKGLIPSGLYSKILDVMSHTNM